MTAWYLSLLSQSVMTLVAKSKHCRRTRAASAQKDESCCDPAGCAGFLLSRLVGKSEKVCCGGQVSSATFQATTNLSQLHILVSLTSGGRSPPPPPPAGVFWVGVLGWGYGECRYSRSVAVLCGSFAGSAILACLWPLALKKKLLSNSTPHRKR